MRYCMRFTLQGTAIGRLEAAHGHRRHFDRLKALLYELGNYCFERRNNGIFAISTLRLLPLTSHPRTLLYSHFPALVECGAIEMCDRSEAGSDRASYQFVGFHEHNLSAKQLDERRKQAQEDWTHEKRRQRAQKSFTECVDSVKAQSHEKAVSIENLQLSEKCPVQPTELTKSERLRSETNPSSTARTKSISEVDSTKEKQRQGGSLTDFGATVAAFIQKVQQDKPTVVVEALSEEDMAVVDQLASTAPPTKSTGKKKSDGEKLPIRLAKKPKTKTPLNEHLIDNALRELGLTPATPLRDAFWADMRAIGVCAEDVEYGVRETNRQKAIKHIRNPLAYTRKIVVGQEQARLGIVI